MKLASESSVRVWLDRIEALHPQTIDLGLARVEKVYRRLVDLRVAPFVVKVGGTNGKGTSARFIEALLAADGQRVACYTSPHLLRFNERIRVDARVIEDQDLIAAFEAVERAREDERLTYFEYTTLAALWWIASQRVDAAVLEIGLGGRLDAVNVVVADLAIVTSVGLDHQAYLGTDRESIGFEKAGIYDRGEIGVCADPDPPETVARQARERGARFLQLGADFAFTASDDSWCFEFGNTVLDGLPRPAGVPLQNFAGALAGLAALGRLPRKSIVKATLAAWRIAGRLQRVPGPVEWVLDVAHNIDAARVLAAYLTERVAAPTTIGVLGMLEDKPVEGLVCALADNVSAWVCAGVPGDRGLTGAALAARVRAATERPVRAMDSVAGALALARSRAGPGDRVVVCGSFRTIGPALAWLGIYSRATGDVVRTRPDTDGP